MMKNKIPYTLCAVLAVALTLGGCAGFGTEITPEPRGDAVIATRIKGGLIEDETLDAAAIHVEADQGRVTLSGFVETEAQKNRAAEIARQEAGGEVDNRIEVK